MIIPSTNNTSTTASSDQPTDALMDLVIEEEEDEDNYSNAVTRRTTTTTTSGASTTSPTNRSITTNTSGETTTTTTASSPWSSWSERLRNATSMAQVAAEKAASGAAVMVQAASEAKEPRAIVNRLANATDRLTAATTTIPTTNSTVATELAPASLSLNGGESTTALTTSQTAASLSSTVDTSKRRQQQTPGLYLQTSLGAYLPLSHSKPVIVPTIPSIHSTRQQPQQQILLHRSSSCSELKATTSSVLVVRLSEAQPCPPNMFSYQWYRIESSSYPLSSSPLSSPPQSPPRQQQQLQQHTSPLFSLLVHNEIGNNSQYACTTNTNSLDEPRVILLRAATNSTFQPSATEVGHRLRCVVTCQTHDDDDDDDDDGHEGQFAASHHPLVKDETQQDSAAAAAAMVVAVCDTPDVIAADSSLFNGARQALVRGAQFGGLVGRGKAAGRIFRLSLEMARSEDATTHGSSIVLYQVAGQTAEPIQDVPIFRASALSDPLHPKAFSLIFPEAQQQQQRRQQQRLKATSSSLSSMSSESMIAALSTNGEFQLEAQNRLTRETLLLALGIANYRGKPIDLDERTVLFATPFAVDSDSGTNDVENWDNKKSKSPTTTSLTALSPASSQRGLRGRTGSSCSSVDSVSTSASPSDSSSASQSTIELDDDEMVAKIGDLERELDRLRTKLANKDKVVSQLQRQITTSDSNLNKSERALAQCQAELKKALTDCQSQHAALRDAQKRIDSHEAMVLRLKGDHAVHISFLEERIKDQSGKCGELEKMVKTLQNEKAVLTGAVEARESKLSKMSALQKSFDDLSIKVAQHDALRVELSDTSQRYQDICRDLERVSQFEQECREELQKAHKTVETLNVRLVEEQGKNQSLESRLASLQKLNQTLKAERNNYKQKSESLSKEIGRICRNGRTINDLEKLIADEDSRREEVAQLVAQKRKALEDLHHYRTALEQCRLAQKQAASVKTLTSISDQDLMRMLERNAELERIVSELTEYVDAKEMQLETLKQVNVALELEIHTLAQAHMSTNEV